MRRYIARRLLQALPVLILVTMLSFFVLMVIPGDPVLTGFTGGSESLDPAAYEARRHELGLDQPLPVQYLKWLGKAVQGDFGTSTLSRLPVSDQLWPRLWVTIQLGTTALLLALTFAIPAGVASAYWPNSWVDKLVTLIAIGGVAVPDFWFGTLLIIVLSANLNWLPSVGFTSPFNDPIAGIESMVMPTLVLGWAGTALLARQIRSSMVEVLHEDYIRTARAKGLLEATVVTRHALRNSLLPSVTILGLLVGRIVAGTVVVEQVFSIPGMGNLLVNAIFNRDFPIVQATVSVVAVSVVLANLVADVSYAKLDPRIQYS